MKVLSTLSLSVIFLFACQNQPASESSDGHESADTVSTENNILLEGEKHF